MSRYDEKPGALETSVVLIRGGTATWIPSAGLSMGAPFQGVETVLVRKIEPSEICPGMIIVYSRRERWVAHRVICVLGSGYGLRFRMKGDGVAAYDSPDVEASECIGEVVGLMRGRTARMFGLWERTFGRTKALSGLVVVEMLELFRRVTGRR